jgi:chorismate mutase / prephenate dehydratase
MRTFAAEGAKYRDVNLPGLNEVRAGIDQIDRQILGLLQQRVALVLQVGEIKRVHSAPIYDPERERQVLERLASACSAPLTAGMVQRVFECVIHESRQIEQQAAPPHAG